MAELFVSREELDSFAQAGTDDDKAATPEWLLSVITAIQQAMGDAEGVTLGIESATVHDLVESAFVATPAGPGAGASASSGHIRVTVAKVGR